MTDTVSDGIKRAGRVVGDPGSARGPFVFTCDHASNHVPGLSPSPSDSALLNQHWGWDIGAASVVESLCQYSDSVAVLTCVSRLVIDVNRAPDSETLVVTQCEDVTLDMNSAVDSAEIERRTATVFHPFHSMVESTMEASLKRHPVNLVSIHSFTPIWAGVQRAMEIGILFDRYEEDALRLQAALAAEGFLTELNAPYSGLTGELMYSAARHGDKYQRPYLELEIRQDLISSPEGVRIVSEKIARALSVFRPR